MLRAELHGQARRTLKQGLAGLGEDDALRQRAGAEAMRSWNSVRLCAESGKLSCQTARTDHVQCHTHMTIT